MPAATQPTLTARSSRRSDAMESDPGRVDPGVDESGDYDLGLDTDDGITPSE